MIEESKDQMDFIIDNFGNKASLYTPDMTYNEEGDRKTELGTPKTINILTFDASAEEFLFKLEGVDMTQTYRLYMKADESPTKSSIIKWDDNYYKILAISHITFQDTVAYHSLVITKTKFSSN